MLTFNTNCKSCKKKKSWVYAQLFWSSCTFFFCCEMHWDLNASHSPFVRSGGEIIKLQNDSLVLSAFLEIRWPGKSRWLFSFMLEICLGFPWSQKWDILALCAWVVTILQQKNVLGPACLVRDILYNHPVVIVLDIHWAFSCLTRNKNKN